MVIFVMRECGGGVNFLKFEAGGGISFLKFEGGGGKGKLKLEKHFPDKVLNISIALSLINYFYILSSNIIIFKLVST